MRGYCVRVDFTVPVLLTASALVVAGEWSSGRGYIWAVCQVGFGLCYRNVRMLALASKGI